jgi:Family of unknown function (DUF6492)
MPELAVITPSYAPDLELCRDLNASVLARMPASVVHHIVTPRRDLRLFSQLRGPRTELWSVDQILPGNVVALPRANFWLNLRRPVPPIRGWVMQQVVKLQAAAKIEADVLLMVDSDVFFIRPVTAETYRRGGRLLFYRKDAAVDQRLPRHLIWHDVARSLLGIPPARPPLPDYINPIYAWDRQTVLGLQDRIQRITGRPWLDAMAARLHVSESFLYGVFVDEVLGENAHVARTDRGLCRLYWGPGPLSPDRVPEFIRAMPAEDVSVMISSKSYTPDHVRRSCYADILTSIERQSRSYDRGR